ncbi:sensor histidine kinase [Staphylococcus argenteus]|uniref:sensor histidine kinase n=1 Tax=Staphylococcus argenteus TaxID=985002 RepID=UPI002024B431|nr:sensor histidine kinase [Staphylococcus argenteus]URL24758.1 sensor histidine kinase [Staphylococcus argenteus]HDY9447457.1 sensor histidine kinase [Staphylococcus argenteus]HDY9461184.1 sensor histidine kinase [Staphylococcus argenteus]
MKFLKGTSIAELSSLLYLIFPIAGIFFNEIHGPKWLYIILVSIFSVSYFILVTLNNRLNHLTLYILLMTHYVIICYFVLFIHPILSLFFFYSAFAIPFTFKKSVKKVSLYMFILTLIICLIITFSFYNDYFVSIMIYYVVILLIMLDNFKKMKNREYQKEIEEKNRHINTLIAEQERHRIGQDLHDTLGHVFASLSLKSELAYKLIDSDIEKTKAELLAINKLSRESLNKVREIIDDIKLPSFIEEIDSIGKVLKDADIDFTFENKELAQVLSPTKQSMLVMIAREAINNVIKHANASKVHGKLQTVNNHKLQLMIEDDGKGIDSDCEVKSISQRVQHLNGTLAVDSTNRTKIIIEISTGGIA